MECSSHFSACWSRLKSALYWVITFSLKFVAMICDSLTSVMVQCSRLCGGAVLFVRCCFNKTLSPRTKGRGLACCFMSATSLTLCLRFVSVFSTSSILTSGVCCSASGSLVWYSRPLKSRIAGDSLVVLCRVGQKDFRNG